MPAAISPTTVGSPLPYAIAGSKGVVADLQLDLSTNNPSELTVKYPTGTAGVQIVLTGGPASSTQDLTAMASGSTVTLGTRTVHVDKSSAAGTEQLTCQITALSAAVVDTWRVRISAPAIPAAPGWSFQQPDNDPAAHTITRLMCDPTAGFAFTPSSAPHNVREKATITFAGSAAIGAGTVVGSPPPTTYARWSFSGGSIAIPAFPSCGAPIGPPAFVCDMPGVYADTSIDVTEEVWFDSACPTVGFLRASATKTVTIQPTPQRLALVLDRSGSMWADNRWPNAVAAARLLVHLMAALRPGVNAGDRIGILVFEDSTCNWHVAPIDPLIADKIPLGTLTSADGLISATPSLDFGNPGSCTPIGDALVKAMDDLGALGVLDEPHFTIILLTDGIENSGTVKVDPDTSTPAFVSTFATQRATRANVNNRLSIFAIGLGTWVQDHVLNQLPLPSGLASTTSAPHYRNVTKVHELVDAIGQMVSFSQEARQKPPLAAGPDPADPGPPTGARYFALESNVRMLAVAILWTLDPADTLVLSRRDLPTTAATPFTPVAAAVKKTPSHGFVSVDLGANAPGTQWRLEHQRGGVAQTIADEDILIFKDLFAKADVVFDRRHYGTGDSMTITARFRAGDQPVSGASVSVELARPGQSLGTFLVKNSANYRPKPQQGGDPLSPKAAMLHDILQRRDGAGFGIVEPRGIFVDGTDDLWEDTAHPDGPGNYVNTFADIADEGTYTFRFYVQGTLPDGSPFDQVMTISRWVGVSVDPIASPVNVSYGLAAPGGMNGALVVVTPVDAAGQFLGPFWDNDVEFHTTSGQLTRPAAERYDGTYARELVYPKGALPVVTVTVQGKPMPPVVVSTGCLGLIIGPLQKLCKWILAFAAKSGRKHADDPERKRDDDGSRTHR